jgi:hypothetical protein
VGLLSGVAQFLGSYFQSGLKLLIASVAIVVAGLALTFGLMRGWHAGRRKVALSINVKVLVVLVLLFLGGLGGAIGRGVGILARPSPTTSPSITTSATPTITASQSPSPSPSASPTVPPPPPPIKPKVVAVACGGPRSATRGEQFDLTYVLNASRSISVGFGAGFYDNAGNDRSNGDGDIDEKSIPEGISTVNRTFTVPANIPAGSYELTGEIWPANKIGGNTDTLAESTCATVKVS